MSADVKKALLPVFLCLAACMVQRCIAQPATPEQMGPYAGKQGYATMHFQTNIGSFKMIDAEGRAEISFRGTLMISQLKDGAAVFTGNVQKQYDDHGRQVWFGVGKVVVTGKWRAIQWFGRNMKGVWYGKGLLRMAGEFDKDLYTGEFWFDDPSQKQQWTASGTYTASLPPIRTPSNVQPRIKDTTPRPGRS